MSKKPYFGYWGKLDKSTDSLAFHQLAYHSLDVAAVAYCWLQKRQRFTRDMAEFVGLDPGTFCRLITLLVALHDLGKFASAFQGLAGTQHPSLVTVRSRHTYDAAKAHHDRLGYVLWMYLQRSALKHICDPSGLDRRQTHRALDALTVLMECSLGHHGQPINTKEWRFLERDYLERHNIDAATAFFADVAGLLPVTVPVDILTDDETQARLKQLSWHIAGIVVLADWLGSNREHFSYKEEEITLQAYWEVALEKADDVLQTTELGTASKVHPFLSVEQHFNFTPTPLQDWAQTIKIDASPQLFILEDLTGAGKTEAALVLTHRLLEAGAADGFYFGLPTMATSNAMFDRVADYYQNMLQQEDGGAPSIVLAHAARDMHPAFREVSGPVGPDDRQYSKDDDTATIQCNQWLADSRKKALLAPVGVGTIDQALLAVLPRKHQSLRLLGLSRKVLIFDEVHAADAYMFELLESVLTLHAHQGGSVVLLTATLPQKQRQRLINIWLQTVQRQPYILQSSHFPLATSVNLSAEQPVIEHELKVGTGAERHVEVRFLHDLDSCIKKICSAVRHGESVVWVRNTVADAVDAYHALLRQVPDTSKILLFHSRFTLHDRQRIETQVLQWLGKQSNATQRAGRIIVATQVLQESLDIDADVMVSDLCPIDDLIQRAGRLHRHVRDAQGNVLQGQVDGRSKPVLWVHAPQWTDTPSAKWLQAEFAGTQAVYRSPGRLWLGMRKLHELGCLQLPDKARDLIEAVYGEDVYDQIPEALLTLEHQVMGEESSKKAAGKSNSLNWRQGYSLAGRQNWFDDEHDISTRFSDVEVANVVLLRRTGHQLEPWVPDGRFSWQLSTVRLPLKTYANQLMTLPEPWQPVWDQMHQRHRHLKFLQPWLVEDDPVFTYDASVGVHRKVPA